VPPLTPEAAVSEQLPLNPVDVDVEHETLASASEEDLLAEIEEDAAAEAPRFPGALTENQIAICEHETGDRVTRGGVLVPRTARQAARSLGSRGYVGGVGPGRIWDRFLVTSPIRPGDVVLWTGQGGERFQDDAGRDWRILRDLQVLAILERDGETFAGDMTPVTRSLAALDADPLEVETGSNAGEDPGE
jgi:co-chaperonin GroES (HSP10)